MAAIKALQQWCKNQCDGYKDVTITNMTTSFRDGLAFCALIHKYRPDLINYESLRKENIYENNKLAFCVAEEHLGIPALLDAEDMVALTIPDRLSILTYVSQYYNYFNGRSPIGGVGGVKRPAEDSKEEPSEKKNLPVVAKAFNPKAATENCPPAPLNQKQSPPLKSKPAAPQKAVLVESSNKTGTLNSKCAVCKTHVHLVQRHLVDGKLYHRSCFKCSECSNPLLPGTYKTGREPGLFVCSAHQNGYTSSLPCASQKSTSGLVKAPTTSAPPAVAVQVQKKEEKPTVPQMVSVLNAPIRVTPRPVEPSPAPQPWTPSAQKTQAARRNFFQSSTPAPSPFPAPAPSSAPAPAPAPSLSTSQTPRESVGHQPASTPTKPGTTPSRPASKPDEKDRARALITRKLAEGNCNNNNTAYQSGFTTDQNWSGKGLRSAGAPSWRLEKRSQGTAGGGAAPTHTTITSIPTSTSTILTPTTTPALTPTPTPVMGTSPTSSFSSKESLWLAAIRERERARARAPPGPVATASTTTTTSALSPSSAALACGAKAATPIAGSEGSAADWRSKLQPSPNGPSLKAPEAAPEMASRPVVTYKASLCITVNSSTTETPPPSTSTSLPGPGSCRPPSDQQPHRKSSGAYEGEKAFSESSLSSWTAAFSRTSSANGPSSVKPPSPKQCRRGSAGFGSLNESCYANGVLNGSSSQSPPVASCVQPHRASSPKQTRRGSGGTESKSGGSISTGPTPRWRTPVSLTVSPSEPTKRKAPAPKHPLRKVPADQGSANGHHSLEQTTSVTALRSPAKAHHIPMAEIVKELGEIEESLSELEREGVDLERRLRSYEEEGSGDILMDPLMVDWFNLIRKKQTYMRRESELVYIAKTQDLEEQQPGVEGELRRLLDKPEHLMSELERRRQSELMERLLEIINDRNAIVEGLDQDRLREEEEDQQLNEMMQKLGVKRAKSKRQSSFSKLFRRKSKRVVAEG